MTPQDEFRIAFTAIHTEWERDKYNKTPQGRRLQAYTVSFIMGIFVLIASFAGGESRLGLCIWLVGLTCLFLKKILIDVVPADSKAENDALRKATNLTLKSLPRLVPLGPYGLTEEELNSLEYILATSADRESHFADPRLALAVITTIGKVGDRRFLQHLRPLARVRSLDPGQQRIASAARKCITAIEKRRKHEAESMTLLRPTDGSALPSTLLRPARNSAATDQELLLHPAANSEPEDHA
jgi:hypothetical protein